jgi:WD40 repeat protein
MPESTSPAAAIGTPSPSAGQNQRNNPYVGPRALGPGESIYGRERELLDLRDLLIAERIVLLYSPSGAGKTSLIQAGLIPEMKREEFGVLPLMRVGKNSAATTGNRYLASAILSLEEQLAPGDGSLPVADIAGISFADYLERREDLLPAGDSKLLIFDQFEEILTVDPLDQEGKAEFFAQVGAVLRDSSRWALFSIREDYVAALDPYTRAVPTRLKSNLRLDLLTPEAARLAIEEPARNRNVSFTPEATSQLIDDLRRVTVQSRVGTYGSRLGPYVEPVHLQVVCSQLWEKPRSNPAEIGVAELATIGDVDSALGEYYAAHVGEVAREADVKEKAIREWFDRSLITESGIRSEVMWQPGGSEGLNNAAIDALEAAHLVRKEERRDATWLELSHNRLVTPIRTNNARWFGAHLSLLQQQSVLWHRQNRNDALCLRGQALIEAQAWAEQHPGELTPTDHDFLTVSDEKERLRSTAQMRQRAMFFGSGFVITLALLAFALIQWRAADTQRNRAEKETQRAEKETKTASTRGLAALAYRMLDERLDLGTLLAYEASQRMDLPDTRGALLAATIVNPRLVSFLHGQQSPVGAVAFTPDGKWLAVGDFTGRIVLWNVKTHRPERVFPKFFNDAVRAIAFSSDGKYMAASSKDGAVVLREFGAGSGEKQNVFSVGLDVWSVAFSPDSALLASGDSSGTVTVFDVATGTKTTLPDKGVGETRSVAFSRSGLFLAAGYQDGCVVVWRRQDSQWTRFDEFSGSVASEKEKARRGSRIICIAFSPRDDNLLASGSRDWTVNLRDVVQMRNLAQGKHWGSLNSLAFAPDGTSIISGAQDSTLRLWKVPQQENPADSIGEGAVGPPAPLEQSGRPFLGHVGSVLATAFSPDGRTVASGGIDREAILWDTAWTEGPPSDTTTANFVLGLSPNGQMVVAGYSDGHIVCRDRVSGKVADGPAHNKLITSVNFSSEGRWMLSSSSDQSSATLIVSDVNSPGSEPVRIEIGRRITFARLSPDGKRVAVAAYRGEILLWDVEKREQIGPPLLGLEDNNNVYAVAFSRDGKRLAAGGTNQCAIIWNIETRTHIKQFFEHNGSVRAIAFSPDGATIATASGDNTVILSDPESGKAKGPPLVGHRGPVVALAFHKDGKILASGGEDKGVVLWNVETRQQVSPRMVKHSDAVRALEFTANVDQLFSVSSLEDPFEWDLRISSLAAQSRARANRNMTESEWQAYMDVDPYREPYRKTWPELPHAHENVAPPEQ